MEIADVEAARERIAGAVLRTPVIALDDSGLLAKCESLQETGSFKLRGATNAVRGLRPSGVVTASSGNHGRALALAARRAGIPATIVMPHDASPYKRAAVEALGATVVESPPDTAGRAAVARQAAAEGGLTMVPAYDHPLVMAGQGTAGLELAEQVPEATTVVVPLGGGGLLSGVATAVTARLRGVRVVGVEPAAGDDFVRSRREGRRVQVAVPDTICDGARTDVPGELTWPVVEARVDDLVAVGDDEVIEALRLLARSGIWAEPTGALAVAGAVRLGLGAGTVCVVTGRNVAPADLLTLIGVGGRQ